MDTFYFPTTLYVGEGALNTLAKHIKKLNYTKLLLVADQGLAEAGLIDIVSSHLEKHDIDSVIYDQVHPNPIEQDVIDGAVCYNHNNCQAIIALGGGSPLDAAKAIRVLVNHPAPLSIYDLAKGGHKLIKNDLPDMFAIPTTAGTGSEVGRAAVVILKNTGVKSVIFHSGLLPQACALEPSLTTKLPKHLTAATGIDALTHAIEAYFAPNFHPMCDGIALEAIQLIIDYLPIAYNEGHNITARSRMQLAASMAATAFQKGLGMVHSLAHPLSAEYNMHHGLANALLLAESMAFISEQIISGTEHKERRARMEKINHMFKMSGFNKEKLADNLKLFIESFDIKLGLKHHIQLKEADFVQLSALAYADGIHVDNMIKVSEDDLLQVYQRAY